MAMQYHFHSPLGKIRIVASSRGLREVSFPARALNKAVELKGDSAEVCFIREAVKQLNAYFAGKLRNFDVPLDAQGTAFQRRVWSHLRRIPYGQAVAYRDLAQKMGHPKAARAVGSANGKNPLCIIVPCHRVISADGGLGGYSAGIKRKAFLLKHEQKFVSSYGNQYPL